MAAAVGLASAETVRDGAVQVSFGGSVSPKVLPREGTTPVAVTVSGKIRDLAGVPPPSLRRISIEVNRLGVLDRRGLPLCPRRRLQATSTDAALAACAPAIVGEGRVGGVIVLPEQDPTRFKGRVLAFNGRLPDGRPAILAQLYTTVPGPFAFVLPFAIGHAGGGFGVSLVATVPPATRESVHITSFSLRLHRTFALDGEERSYLSAGCPAPEGFGAAPFPLVRATYSFVAQPSVGETLVRSCRVSR